MCFILTRYVDNPISTLFGDDDSDEENVLKSTTTPSADASGLFGSDSSDDEQEEKKPIKKKRRLNQEDATLPEVKVNSGDEYDSDQDILQTKDDEDFIDEDDDLADVLGEYSHDKQEFNDQRPAGYDSEEDAIKKRREEENFFDETLKNLKSGRKKRGLALSPQETEQLVQEILYRMDTAHNADEISITEGKPAIQKLKLLDTVVDVLSKVHLQSILLDFNLLEVMRKWVQPLANGSLPNVGIRTKLLNASRRLPIFKDHLKRSGYGKIVMALFKHPDETDENKQVCRELIERWSRSVFDKSMDYKRLAEYEQEAYHTKNQRRLSNSSSGRKAKNATAASSLRVQIPQAIQLDFVHRPGPKFDPETQQPPASTSSATVSTRVDPESRKGRLLKRMQALSRTVKKTKSAIPMSIEGRNN